MQLVAIKAIIAMVWGLAVSIAGIAGNLNAFSSWTVLLAVAVLPPVVMMRRWNDPSPDHLPEPGGTPMTSQVATLPDSEAAIRWRNWQARGAENDRRTATRMRRLVLIVAAALAVWLFVQLA